MLKYPTGNTHLRQDSDPRPFPGIMISTAFSQQPPEEIEPFAPIGPWKTREAFEMRRIRTLHNADGAIVAYRPVIQQGHGESRHSYSTVFRIIHAVGPEVTLKQAMLWRDAKEADLGIVNGARSKNSSHRYLTGLSLIVTKSRPYRAAWTSSENVDGKRVRVYIGRRGYQEAYEQAVRKLAELRGIALTLPIPSAPYPQSDQYERLIEMNIKDLPDRRKTKRT
ncbi:hypothetical protein QAO71_17925 (plasmid) [Halopseudomonas sp. SMJS2]|uniref:hypothetical protein n=1 Tax=Halopseudomonas sp. SMJS2 TaxID=3041098 RepID=UPI0024533855|nr:hypothetical protein [Halopseudomonas sp. SMJS2]WGK63421.1 hypothetical protein QAO71_17925 [Halopseudomonas sp. SMJS2]